MSEPGRSSEPDEWLAFSERNLRAMRTLSAAADEHPEAVVFWAQQVVEKSLKAVLALEGSRAPRTHDLAVLVQMVSAELPFLSQMHSLEQLTRMAVGSRYPDMHISIDEQCVALAVQTAESAYEQIARHIREQESE